MSLKLLEPSSTLLLPLRDVKNYLRIDHDIEDDLIKHLILLATQWVEEATGKSLLRQKWSYTHQNNVLLLPNPPIVEVLEVRTKRKILAPKDFEIHSKRGKTEIHIPFAWEKRTFTVVYLAGFGETPEDLPLALQHAVLTTVGYLYENRLDSQDIRKKNVSQGIQPWIHYHRTLEMA
jgi:uncharacterized phiE125 gp8 family phage protein